MPPRRASSTRDRGLCYLRPLTSEGARMTFHQAGRRPRATVLLSLVALSAIACAAIGAYAPPVGAQRLRATLYVTQASIPRGLSEKALIGFARGHASRALNESSEPEI